METTDSSIHPSEHRSATRHFVRHFLEMVLAMLVGMVLLAPLWTLAWPGMPDRADLAAMIMATDMAIGMAAWMLVRRHSWISIVEMSAAMYLPFVVLLVPFWAGAVSGGTLMIVGHVLMLPAMLVAMLWRRDEYLH